MAKRPQTRANFGRAADIAKAGYLPRLFTQQLPRVKPFSEMGVSGVPVYAGYVLTPERNVKLIGQERYRTFADILANTSIVAAGVRYFLNAVARPAWSIEPADDSDEAKQLAEFVEGVFYEDLHTPWSRVVRRSGMYRFHGFSIQEWTAVRRDDGKIGFHDIESRPQWTIWRWEVDERGTVIGAWQRDPLTGRELGLPRGKVCYLVDDTLTDSPEGMGLLRHLVEPAERLKEYLDQESTGYMRDLRGIPMGRAPMDEMNEAVASGQMTEAARDKAIKDLQDFVNISKKGRMTSMVLNSQPYLNLTDSGTTVSSELKWGMDLVSGVSPGLAEISKAIDRLNYDMARIIGVEHLLLGSTSSGSFALAKEKASDLYLLANSVLRDIRLQAQHDFLWPLWSLNGFKDELMPNFKSEDVAPKDAEQVARVMRDMAVAGVTIPPDDEAINFVRDLLGVPHLDLSKYMEAERIGIVSTGGGRGAKSTPTAMAAAKDQDMQADIQDYIDTHGQMSGVDKAMDREIRKLRKVIGDTAADYIHDFVHSSNKKFRGKSKEERIQMALGAFYGKAASNGHDKSGDALAAAYGRMQAMLEKVVPYKQAQPYRDEDEAIVGQSGAPDQHYQVDDHFDPAAGARTELQEGGPGARAARAGREEATTRNGKSDGQSDVLVPGSGMKKPKDKERKGRKL